MGILLLQETLSCIYYVVCQPTIRRDDCLIFFGKTTYPLLLTLLRRQATVFHNDGCSSLLLSLLVCLLLSQLERHGFRSVIWREWLGRYDWSRAGWRLAGLEGKIGDGGSTVGEKNLGKYPPHVTGVLDAQIPIESSRITTFSLECLSLSGMSSVVSSST